MRVQRRCARGLNLLFGWLQNWVGVMPTRAAWAVSAPGFLIAPAIHFFLAISESAYDRFRLWLLDVASGSTSGGSTTGFTSGCRGVLGRRLGFTRGSGALSTGSGASSLRADAHWGWFT